MNVKFSKPKKRKLRGWNGSIRTSITAMGLRIVMILRCVNQDLAQPANVFLSMRELTKDGQTLSKEWPSSGIRHMTYLIVKKLGEVLKSLKNIHRDAVETVQVNSTHITVNLEAQDRLESPVFNLRTPLRRPSLKESQELWPRVRRIQWEKDPKLLDSSSQLPNVDVISQRLKKLVLKKRLSVWNSNQNSRF